ncbi:MAG: hypothetical protein J0G96_04950 [Flavobacteriia bacterium]|nr:hypothetical protein [Flavobacteriia bacterium]OJX35314.1 MAG: hypothetical protein BGO87_11960 [Flavobacteriia bacterium 40-80]
MKHIFSVLFVAVSFGLAAQKKEVKITEENYNFSVGSKNAIVVTIPDSKKEVVEKELKNELKSWGGKMTSGKGEYSTLQSANKKLFEGKTFDTYTRIFQDGQDVKVAVATDLGGAYLSSNQHPSQFNEFKEKLYAFAVQAGNQALAVDVKAEEKILKTQEKELKAFEKQDASYKKEIDNYKKKIDENERKIKDNEVNISKKKEEISKQEDKIKSIKNTKVK